MTQMATSSLHVQVLGKATDIGLNPIPKQPISDLGRSASVYFI